MADGPGSYAVRPPQIFMTGDTTEVIGGAGFRAEPLRYGRIRWSSYTRSSAVGWGDVEFADCMPSCGGGGHYAYPVKIVASRPSAGRFARMSLTFSVDGVRLGGTYALHPSATNPPWRPLRTVGPSYPTYCGTDRPDWGATAFFWNVSTIRVTCSQVISFTYAHELALSSFYFKPGSYHATFGAWKCTVFGFVAGQNPPLFTHGTGQILCTTGSRGFEESYSD